MNPPTANSRIARLLEFHTQNPTDPFLCHALGLEYFNAGDLTEAISYFRKGLEADPGYVASYYHLGKVQEAAREWVEADRVYRLGIEAAARAGDAHARGELEAALQLLTESSHDA